eukprot:2319132-Amphidinium_carterae.1
MTTKLLGCDATGSNYGMTAWDVKPLIQKQGGLSGQKGFGLQRGCSYEGACLHKKDFMLKICCWGLCKGGSSYK